MDNFGTATDPVEKLQSKAPLYAEQGVALHFTRSQDGSVWAVLIVTPIMRRTQQLHAAREIVFIYSTASCDAAHSTVTMLLAATNAGAVPIAAIMHSSQSTEGYSEGYTEAFGLLRNHYPSCFGGMQAPQAFMTDHSMAEKGALAKIWPDGTQLLCHFHLLQAEWRWLTSTKNNVRKDERQNLLAAFQRILRAKSEAELEAAKAGLHSQYHPGYSARVDALLEKKEELVMCFRAAISTRGHNTNSFAEACVRILKDIVLNRTKAFNAVALADFIATVWEKYFENRILKHAHGRVSAHQLLYHRLLNRMNAESVENIVVLGNRLYQVPSAEKGGQFYEVWADAGVCSCPSGQQGGFCKHQAAVHMRYGGLFPNAPLLNAIQRHELGKLALGQKCPDYTFFCDFQENMENPSAECLMAQDTEPELPELQSQLFLEPQPSTSGARQTEHVHKGDMHAVQEEQKRLVALAGHNDTFNKCLQKIAQRLRSIKTESGAVNAAIIVSTALTAHTRRGGKIKVQPTAIARRREGVTKGSRRIPAGRPSKETVPRRTKKRRHTLSSSVRDNVPHAKLHGQGH
ncbi:uncharacterized protein LOC135371754 [Ornithodoros turicata]|uniref:uncharacterized protein LOC135371754 n=1 Tax=Ornithodoros turicata TaxID=34597 RepID=UPI003138BE7E